jgi:acyl-CoA synthetase (AMP-forming)/AMP-acid ligase II
VTAEFVTVPAILRHRAQADRDVLAIVSETAEITYGGLGRESLRFGAWLVAHGVVKGSRVGLLAPNGVDWAVAALAAIGIGAVLVPLSTFLKPRELNAQLAAAAVTHLILVKEFRGRDYAAELGEAAAGFDPVTGVFVRSEDLPSLRAVWFREEVGQASAGVEALAVAEAMDAQVRPSDDLAIIFTSGSRGAPKGVIHTHGNAMCAVQASLETRCIGAGDRLYIPMPFFWVGGFSQGLIAALAAGATLLTEAEPEPTRTLKFLEANKVTLFRGWPEQAQALSRHPDFARTDLSSLKAGSLDGVLPPSLRARPGARASLLGMTETFGTYSGAPLDRDMPQSAFGSCGRPFPTVELRIVDPETGAPCATGETGMIQLRGPHLMRGMVGRQREEVFTPDLFYATGDLARLDADGYLFFEGRADDLLKVKGVTVNPSEVEAELAAVAGVRRAMVVDLPGAGEGTSELGAVVLAERDRGLAPRDLAAAARKTLSAFKVPTRWVILHDDAAVPVLATGKLDKVGLQNLLRNSPK